MADVTRVAIVGRPNVGKSSLFNRMVGRRVAVVEERAKVTRDLKVGETNWRGRTFEFMDTGGWLGKGDALDQKVSKMAERAVREADVVLFLVDVRTGVTDEDLDVAKMLHRRQGTTLIVANKVDHERYDPQIYEFLQLGFGDPVAISAMHGRNTGDLLDTLGELTGGFASDDAGELPIFDDRDESDGEEELPLTDAKRTEERELSVAIVGRPNAGKSTLFNRVVGQERAVVYDRPGTTVDTIDTVIETEMGPVRFFDTAGLRRRSRYAEATEYYSMVRTLRAIDSCNVAILVVDATVGVTGWDQRLAERIDLAGSPIVLVLNKWDLLDHDARLMVNAQVSDRLSFLTGVEPMRISAQSGKGIHRLLPKLFEAQTAYRSRVPTGELNRFLRSLQGANPPREGRILYIVQGASEPPTFTLFVTKPLTTSYLKFLENRIREEYRLGSTPIKVRVRRRD
ncbi:MAG: ribosome biogenesis GTPase Der [Ferrimicrobium sp.]|jgi:GTP-binding protein|uniref:GTPase Der n=1 Tax=Ferrimicrobium acidiphilum TaxID=121039 RepID=A0ABV3Y0A9_9ACTN|nr:ribosome biogenesis GTPase Der [Ferrimicrobium sp.]